MIAGRLRNGAIVAAVAAMVSACGGGGGGSAPPSLSADQRVFENLILSPGASYELHWNLNYSGAETSGTNYAESDHGVMAASPLTNGPQTIQQSALENMTTSLAVVPLGPTRVLKNGAILVSPNPGTTKVSYVGGEVQVDVLAADNTTVAYSQTRSNFQTVPLTGAMSSTPADFAHWHNSFFSNPAILNAAATWGAGASYTEYTMKTVGDDYFVADCNAVTTDANVSPCLTSTTLNSALTTGIVSASDGTTYHLADGTVSTVGGVQVWVATAARPQSATLSTTVEYRMYFELNGNVYTGDLIKDGTQEGGSYWVSNPGGVAVTDRLTFLPFFIRMNKAAYDSLKAAMAI